MPPPAPVPANRILRALSPEDLGLLESDLEAVELPLRMTLENRGKPPEFVYFIDEGIASVVANGYRHRSIEVGLIGREGMTGLAIVLDAGLAAHHTYMQLGGRGRRLPASLLRLATDKSPGIAKPMLRYAHVFAYQIANTALANGRSKIEERLARWLLMAHDRATGNALTLTHEFLAVMLGVRRPGVTVALSLLEKAGLIRLSRGRIEIVDRKGLAAITDGAYGLAEAEYRRLFD
jgi:CRP-like cAMP-binding protein